MSRILLRRPARIKGETKSLYCLSTRLRPLLIIGTQASPVYDATLQGTVVTSFERTD
jgi:hypothetical protein